MTGAGGSGRQGGPSAEDPQREGREHRDETTRVRRAGRADRGDDPYERVRRRQAARRAAEERAAFDPRPPSDDDWTVAEEGTDGLRRLRPPTTVGDTLGAVVARRGWTERVRASTIASRWSEVVGQDLALRCEPVRIAGGCLVIRAESQAWATQLRYLRTPLLDNVAQLLGPGLVREIRIEVGPLGPRDHEPSS